VPRWKKRRRCMRFRGQAVFKPLGVPMQDLPLTELELDQLEALRLCDLENKTQEQAGEAMGVSRGTVQRLLTAGRARLVDFVLNGSALQVVPTSNYPYAASEMLEAAPVRVYDDTAGMPREGGRRGRGWGHRGGR